MTCMCNLQELNSEKQSTVVVIRGQGLGEMGDTGQRVQIASYKLTMSEDLMYNMVITANNTVLYLKVAKGVHLKCSHHKSVMVII